jgi:hypothetical protein
VRVDGNIVVVRRRRNLYGEFSAVEFPIVRDLSEDEIALVSGGDKKIGSIIEFPPPKAPEIPPIPGKFPVLP